MKYKILLNLMMIPLFLGGMSSVYGQNKPTPPETGVSYNKVGKNPFTLDPSAALEADSANRGFLPPRMDKSHRDAIKNPAEGLIVWCTDCDESATPRKGGGLSVYTGSEWIIYLPSTANPDNPVTDTPVRLSDSSVKITGLLGNTFGTAPTETGFLFREIKDNDFATLPVFNSNGSVTVPTYKKPANLPVTSSGKTEATIPDLNSKNPYYFRTFAISPSGISYGNTVIFNLAPPVINISPVTFTNGNSSLPVFIGKLTVNAGSPQNTITEYGYCTSSTNTTPATTDNKVILSSTAAGAVALDLLNDKLNSKIFRANPVASLVVNDYNSTLSNNYFRYYAVANGKTIYSDVVNFTQGKRMSFLTNS